MLHNKRWINWCVWFYGETYCVTLSVEAFIKFWVIVNCQYQEARSTFSFEAWRRWIRKNRYDGYYCSKWSGAEGSGCRRITPPRAIGKSGGSQNDDWSFHLWFSHWWTENRSFTYTCSHKGNGYGRNKVPHSLSQFPFYLLSAFVDDYTKYDVHIR